MFLMDPDFHYLESLPTICSYCIEVPYPRESFREMSCVGCFLLLSRFPFALKVDSCGDNAETINLSVTNNLSQGKRKKTE